MKKGTNEWFISAESDLLLVQEILAIENLTHLSAFHAQQSVEKSFKAVIEEFELGFIKTHSLETLYNLVKKNLPLQLDTDILIMHDQLYIDSRYPGEMGLLPGGKPSLSDATEFYRFALMEIETAKKSCSTS
jgi:HEPN domain-containing protein